MNWTAKDALQKLQIDGNNAIRSYIKKEFPAMECDDPVCCSCSQIPDAVSYVLLVVALVMTAHKLFSRVSRLQQLGPVSEELRVSAKPEFFTSIEGTGRWLSCMTIELIFVASHIHV